RGLGTRTSEDRHALVDVGHGGRDYLLLFTVIQGVELTVSAEDENPMHTAGNEMIQKPAQARQIEIFVVAHRRGDGRDDSMDSHRDSLLLDASRSLRSPL